MQDIVDIFAEQYTRAIVDDILNYLNSYVAYRDKCLEWRKDLPYYKLFRNVFGEESDKLYDDILQISINDTGITISIRNPADKLDEDIYDNFIYKLNKEDLLNAVLHYDREVRHMEATIDVYMEMVLDE